MLDNICLPINLDAFVLNEPVVDSGLSRIAPITQPDYVSLRLDNSVIQVNSTMFFQFYHSLLTFEARCSALRRSSFHATGHCQSTHLNRLL